MKIVLGDCNAKIGKETCYREVIGKESIHETTNDNGTRVINFAMENNLYNSQQYKIPTQKDSQGVLYISRRKHSEPD